MAFSLLLPGTIFKAKTVKTRKRKLFCCQIQAGPFFLFQAVIGIFLSIMVLVKNKQKKKLGHMPQTAVSIEHLECLVQILKT